jgi:biofilm PGA synthesis N-glycosyltransferase PgaC
VDLEHRPRVAVLIAAYDEELTIARTLAAVMPLDWPDLEVLVVDDGSTDRTTEIVREFATDPRVGLLTLPENGGKAGALNAGLPQLTSDYVLMLDADGSPAPDALHWMAAHLVRLPHVAAVTGNPRVANTRTLLSRLQSVEFSATVQAAGWQVRYEPRALFAMQVPEKLGVWWRQRVRWARGMGQVLRRFGGTPVSWWRRRLAAIWLEAAVSAVWAHSFLLLTVVWVVLAFEHETRWGANPVVAYWGMVIALLCVAQAVLGIWLDRRK